MERKHEVRIEHNRSIYRGWDICMYNIFFILKVKLHTYTDTLQTDKFPPSIELNIQYSPALSPPSKESIRHGTCKGSNHMSS